MDIQMPRMSGHEAARQIRKIEAADSHIPIIALTAHGLADERDKLIASGINDYVGKPISQPQLLQVLQKWLGRSASSSLLTAENDEHPQGLGIISDLQALDSKTTDTQNTNSHNSDISNTPPQTSVFASSSTAPPTYQMIRSEQVKSYTPTKMSNEKRVKRPLSLKKIRDDYLRDSQPREDYRRENIRDTQPSYKSLRFQEQGQSVFGTRSIQTLDDNKDEPSVNTAYLQNGSNLNASVCNTLDVLDWQDALTRSANKPDLAAKLIIMMLDTVNEEKQALMQAWEAHNRSMLAQIAHRILGGSRYTGVPQLRQASQDLEDKCLLNIQHTTPAQFAMLEPYYEALLTALNNLQTLDLSVYPQLNYHRLSENDMTWKMI
jgi:two-component system sensor histidine kinase BarA